MTQELYALTFISQNREVMVWMKANNYILHGGGILNDRNHNASTLCLAIVLARVKNLQ